MILRAGMILAVLAVVPIGVLAAEPDYSIATIEYAPGPMDKIGKLKAGWVCLPKGTLRWRDVAHDTDVSITALLSSVLVARGLSIALPPDPLFSDPAPLTRYRIKVVIETVHLDLCVAGSRLVKQRPSGGGFAVVRWETYDRVSRALVGKQVFELPLVLHGRDARNVPTVLSEALVESAQRYALTRSTVSP